MKRTLQLCFFGLLLSLLPMLAVAQPVNDAIGDAIVLTGDPAVVLGTTVDATSDVADAGTSFCGTSITVGGVWYQATGSGGPMVATTCSELTTYDSKLSIFSGTPGSLTCIGGNDDDFTCDQGVFDSRFGWESDPGTPYYILVHGFSSAQGPFELTVLGGESGRAGVQVIKTFSDGSTDEVDVTLTCNSGLPLEQTFTIAGGDPEGVTFVVTDIPESGATCEVTESGGPAGYTTELNGGDGCTWEGITGGFYTCEISNEADPATYTVFKDFTVQREGGDVVIAEADVTIECDSAITDGVEDDGTWTLSGTLSDGESLVATVDTTEGPATCSATEEITQSGVEQSSSGCGEVSLPAGGSHTCTFTNTVFFEGIPTLSQYGLALLVLLTLGVGFVGLRRFV